MGPEKKSNVILCGFMATGKSSVGKKLAAILEYDFLDMDAVIEAEEGMTIPEIFSCHGEAAFRALESRMVDRVAGRSRCVVATGGGTVVNPHNLEKLKSCGVVVNLAADVPTILSRIGSGDDRPMLREGSKEERIRTLLQSRAPAYAQADITVDTTLLSIDSVAQLIAERLKDLA